MTGRVLITGKLFARPEKRTLRNGAHCVMAIVKSRDGTHTRLWHIAAFNRAAQVTLLQLSDGDAVAVQGFLKAELYDSSGETRVSCGIIAERALGLRQRCEKRAGEDRSAAEANGARLSDAAVPSQTQLPG